MCQEGMDRFFNTVVLPNFTHGLSVYGASDSDITAIKSFLNRSFKRKYISVKTDIRSILEESDLNFISHALLVQVLFPAYYQKKRKQVIT